MSVALTGFPARASRSCRCSASAGRNSAADRTRRDSSLRGYTLTEDQTDALQCSSSRMVTSEGVFVCPILIDEPRARMGERLADVQRSYPLAHQACFTCHVTGMSCRT